MNAKKTEPVIYCDEKGREHTALVFALNPFHPHHLSLVYVDDSQPEASNLVKKFDVTHISRINEPNPELPTYHLNCWKEYYEEHNSLPSDHPTFDHPHRRVTDQDGNVIPVNRPEYEADLAAHRALSQADGYEPSSEGEPEPQKPQEPEPQPEPQQLGQPSGADLDAIEAEKKIAEATSEGQAGALGQQEPSAVADEQEPNKAKEGKPAKVRQIKGN